MKFLCLCVAVATAAGQTAPEQPPDPIQIRDAVNWASGIRGRFRLMRDRAVRTYGLAKLGAAMCRYDPSMAADIATEAVRSLNEVPDNVYLDHKNPVLPTASFTSLVKLVMAASKCGPSVPPPRDSVRERVEWEHTRQNEFVKRAFDALEHENHSFLNYERLAQMAAGGVEVADILNFDFDEFTNLLIRLHERVPDLTDDVFQQALDLIRKDRVFSTRSLVTLGNYLFIDPRYSEVPEPNEHRTTYTVGTESIPDLGDTRPATDPDVVLAYLRAALDVLQKPGAIDGDPAMAYALAYQVLPKIRDLAPDQTEDLQKIVDAIQLQYGSQSAAVQNALGGKQAADPDAITGDTDSRIIGRVRTAIGAGRFAAARALAKSASVSVGGRLAGWIDFGESAQAIREKDPTHALLLANHLPAGLKRSLLYAGIAASEKDFPDVHMDLGMGLKDAEPFSYELRMCVLPAMAASASRSDPDYALAIFGWAVEADNNANTSPRKSTNSGVYFGPKGVTDFIDTDAGRQAFTLKVPGVSVYSIPAFLLAARGLDVTRLESIILGMRNENRLAKALVALVDLRLGEAKLTPAAGKSPQ